MPRVKRGVTARARHKKILALAKGYRGRRSKVFRIANQAVMRAGQYAYRDRRNRKRVFRALWIARINAAAREHGINYSRFIAGLNRAAIGLDRKVLAELAVNDKPAFAAIVAQVKATLATARSPARRGLPPRRVAAAAQTGPVGPVCFRSVCQARPGRAGSRRTPTRLPERSFHGSGPQHPRRAGPRADRPGR